jgi:hypothetical protein
MGGSKLMKERRARAAPSRRGAGGKKMAGTSPAMTRVVYLDPGMTLRAVPDDEAI